MDRDFCLPRLRAELDTFRACLDGDLSVPVAHCGGWTLHDLAGHLGGGNLWAATAVTERRGSGGSARAPREPAAVGPWFSDTASTLLDVLTDTDPDAEAWTFAPPRTVAFWQRRRCLETLIHRWDAQHALGGAAPFEPALAHDGVSEVFDTFAPRQVRKGRAAPPTHALRLESTDTGGSWTYGPDAPVATVTGSAEHLLLMLWGRLARDDRALNWEGDRVAADDTLNGPLVP